MKPYTQPSATRNWFYPTELRQIYNYPPPVARTIAVLSFGGTLNLSDVQTYWTNLNVPISTVNIITCLGATLDASDSSATAENTLDVETIGATCPGSTINLYIAPNRLDIFVPLLNYVLQDTTNGVPQVISISWGAPEVYFGSSLANSINNAFATAVSRGINICTASGDNGSSNGLPGINADFPCSSPNVIACGGTRLFSPNYTYDNSTIEQAWTSGGGAVSRYFSKPTYQKALKGSYRSVPDIALVADPNTGVRFFVNGNYVIYGGTSVASPLMAAYCACCQFNEFIVPKLYTIPHSNFHDIIGGSNGAYTAIKGYDNCTGLGSINGLSILNALNAPPTPAPSPAPVSAPNQGPVQVRSLRLNASRIKTVPFQLVATTNPLGLSVRWTSSNPGVATVDSNGLVTVGTSKRGITIITAICGNRKDTCVVIRNS